MPSLSSPHRHLQTTRIKACAAALFAFVAGSVAASSAALAAPPASKVEKCLTANHCAYHLIGVATYEPYLQLSVMAKEARGWTAHDWEAAVAATRQRAFWIRANPWEAVKRYDGMPESPPFFARAAANVGQHLNQFSVGIVNARRAKAPRAGVPGWTAVNVPERDKIRL